MLCCIPRKNDKKNTYQKKVIREQVENIYIEENENQEIEDNIETEVDIENEKEMEDKERYVVCDNCDETIDCWNSNIYCLYKGEQKNSNEEMTICVNCYEDLREQFKQEGYNCDDWDESEGEEEEKEEEKEIEDRETHLCLKCSKILRLNELYSIEIDKIHINVCKKCSELSETELNNWYTSTCVKTVKDITLTIKFKSKNYIFVKYENEDINNSINRFIRLVGINNVKINKKINKLIKNKLLKK
tara:strand:- start:3483 stop:4217 length:735 start_codon:yes stop_codon:yes gene_type:complete